MKNNQDPPDNSIVYRRLYEGHDPKEIYPANYKKLLGRYSLSFFYIYLERIGRPLYLIDDHLRSSVKATGLFGRSPALSLEEIYLRIIGRPITLEDTEAHFIYQGNKWFMNDLPEDVASIDAKSVDKEKFKLYKKVYIKAYHEFLLKLEPNYEEIDTLFDNSVVDNKEVFMVLIKRIRVHRKELEKFLADLFTFIESFYILKTLYRDSEIYNKIEQRYIENHTMNLALKKTIIDEVNYKKYEIVQKTLKKVRRDIEEILNTAEFKHSKKDFILEFRKYEEKLNQKMTRKIDRSLFNSKNAKNFFNTLEKEDVNWIMEEDGIKFYPMIYDVLFFKYMLFAIFKTYDAHKRPTREIDGIIESNKMWTYGEKKVYLLLYRHIKNIGDINANIGRLFPGKATKAILGIANGSYPTREKVVLFFHLTELIHKSHPVIAYKIFFSALKLSANPEIKVSLDLLEFPGIYKKGSS